MFSFLLFSSWLMILHEAVMLFIDSLNFLEKYFFFAECKTRIYFYIFYTLTLGLRG